MKVKQPITMALNTKLPIRLHILASRVSERAHYLFDFVDDLAITPWASLAGAIVARLVSVRR